MGDDALLFAMRRERCRVSQLVPCLRHGAPMTHCTLPALRLANPSRGLAPNLGPRRAGKFSFMDLPPTLDRPGLENSASWTCPQPWTAQGWKIRLHRAAAWPGLPADR